MRSLVVLNGSLMARKQSDLIAPRMTTMLFCVSPFGSALRFRKHSTGHSLAFGRTNLSTPPRLLTPFISSSGFRWCQNLETWSSDSSAASETPSLHQCVQNLRTVNQKISRSTSEKSLTLYDGCHTAVVISPDKLGDPYKHRPTSAVHCWRHKGI